jgi:hypothetical protein
MNELWMLVRLVTSRIQTPLADVVPFSKSADDDVLVCAESRHPRADWSRV